MITMRLYIFYHTRWIYKWHSMYLLFVLPFFFLNDSLNSSKYTIRFKVLHVVGVNI